MTVVDFRSGGYGVRDEYRHGSDRGSDSGQDWQAGDDWDEARYEGRFAAGIESARLTDRDSVLGRVARLTHYLGAVVSVGLMAGLGVWGYQLVVRDVSGVPVIRAVEGEGRIAPTEPGGELTDRGGLAVNEVAAGREAAPVEQVAIAPAATTLDSQDVPMGQLGASARQPDGVSDLPVAEPLTGTVAMTDAEAARRLAEDQAAANAAAEGVPAVGPNEADSVSVASAVTDISGQPAPDAITAALTEAGVTPAVTTTTRPLPRPRRIAAAAAPVADPVTVADAAPLVADAAPLVAEAPVPAVADAAPTEAPAAEPAPVQQAKVASGAPLVQIGAFDSGAIAESEWTRISGRYGDLFSGKAPLVQEHKAGGRTFYRLRIAGFDSRDDARKFCAALIEAGTDCIPAAAK